MTKRIDLTGQSFGHLVVIAPAETRGGRAYWHCQCDCGRVVDVRAENLRSGNSTSCGCQRHGKPEDLTGRTFGALTVERLDGTDSNDHAMWICRCDCGAQVRVAATNLKEGRTVSCGCRREAAAREGREKTRRDAAEYGTNPGRIRSRQPTKASTTGVRGVCYLKNKEVYRASITFQGQKYHLLESHSFEECKKARQEAEENIYDDFLAWYDRREAEREGKS